MQTFSLNNLFMICQDNTPNFHNMILSERTWFNKLGYSASAGSCELLNKSSDSGLEYVNDYKCQ